MALIPTIPTITKGDWNSVVNSNRFLQKHLKKLATTLLGPGGSPTFLGVTLTGLTASRVVVTNSSKALASNAALTVNSLLYGSASGTISSLGVATDGQLPIGSTGATPVLATLTGTANQVTVTSGAGSITLSTPQDIHTEAAPEFAGGTFTAVVTGILPTEATHLVTKEYVDLAVGVSGRGTMDIYRFLEAVG